MQFAGELHEIFQDTDLDGFGSSVVDVEAQTNLGPATVHALLEVVLPTPRIDFSLCPSEGFFFPLPLLRGGFMITLEEDLETAEGTLVLDGEADDGDQDDD